MDAVGRAALVAKDLRVGDLDGAHDLASVAVDLRDAAVAHVGDERPPAAEGHGPWRPADGDVVYQRPARRRWRRLAAGGGDQAQAPQGGSDHRNRLTILHLLH